MAEKRKEFNYKQKSTDEEIFESAKINARTLDKLTLSRIVDAIILLGSKLAEKKPYPYQEDFMRRIVWSLITDDGETLVGEFSRQSGKSTSFEIVVPPIVILLPLLAQKMDELGIDSPILKFKNGVWVGVYGPDYDRAHLIGKKINNAFITKTSKQILTTPSIGMKYNDKMSNYLSHLPRGSSITVKSGNKRVSIEGETFHLLITDETQEIDEYVIKKSMLPFLAYTNGTYCAIGSAFPERCYFYEIRTMLKREDIGKTASKKRYFAADYRTVQKYNKSYKKYIAKQKKVLGEHSIEFRMSYELYWAVEVGMFITDDKLNGIIGKDYGVSPFDQTNLHAIGVDVAKVLDSTVVTVAEYDPDKPIKIDGNIFRYEKKIKNWIEFSGDDYDTQFYNICNFIDNYKWKVLAIDATGDRGGLSDRLKAKYEPLGKIIIDFVFGTETKSVGYSLLYRELLAERWSFPNNESAKRLRKQQRFTAQMLGLAKRTKGGYMVVDHVSEKEHDDYGDSWMLVNYAIEGEEAGEEVSETMENIYNVDHYGKNSFLHNH